MMLDAKFVREHIDIAKISLENRNCSLSFDEFLNLEEQRRPLLRQAEDLRNKRNIVSEDIGRLRNRKQDASALIDEMKLVSDRIREFDEQIKIIEERCQ